MLERAQQIAEQAPADAARLVFLVERHRDGEPFYHGVEYDTASILRRAKSAIGADRLRAIRAAAQTEELPRDEVWD